MMKLSCATPEQMMALLEGKGYAMTAVIVLRHLKSPVETINVWSVGEKFETQEHAK